MAYTSILIVLAALCAHTQAVLHGIQPVRTQQQHYEQQLQHNNKHGYRYNGPAHKYLPVQAVPSNEAATITGHWEYNNALHGIGAVEQQRPAVSNVQQQQQHAYNGPYNSQHYQPADFHGHGHGFSNAQENFPAAPAYAHGHKAIAAPSNNVQFNTGYGVSNLAQPDRYVQHDEQDLAVNTQSLPEPHQHQPFAQPDLNSGAPNFVQMQSQSYQLPSSYTMQRDWPHHKPQPHANQLPLHRPAQQYHEQHEHPLPAGLPHQLPAHDYGSAAGQQQGYRQPPLHPYLSAAFELMSPQTQALPASAGSSYNHEEQQQKQQHYGLPSVPALGSGLAGAGPSYNHEEQQLQQQYYGLPTAPALGSAPHSEYVSPPYAQSSYQPHSSGIRNHDVGYARPSREFEPPYY